MNEFKSLSIKQLDELHTALGKCVDILNPEELKLTELYYQNKDLSVHLTLMMIEIFNEQKRRMK